MSANKNVNFRVLTRRPIIIFGATPDDGSDTETNRIIILDNFTTYYSYLVQSCLLGYTAV
jgi:hypothetical protein